MKGLFIPGITAEMFRNGCLESIEELMTEGEIYDIDYQQPCEDLINKRATTCRHGGHCEWVACDKCNHYEPDPLSQQPCDDCISRQEAINCVTSNEFIYKIVEDIKRLPSVTPQPKTGRWIALENRFELGDRVKCSKCGQVFVVGDDVSRHYCPNCGARMIEPQESEDKE